MKKRVQRFISLLKRSRNPFNALDKALLYGGYIKFHSDGREDSIAIQSVAEDLTTQYRDMETED